MLLGRPRLGHDLRPRGPALLVLAGVGRLRDADLGRVDRDLAFGDLDHRLADGERKRILLFDDLELAVGFDVLCIRARSHS
jgi:hypothetical protein